MRLTDPCQHDDMAILPFAHRGQNCFDDIDIGEKVRLKGILHEVNGPATLRQFLHGTDDSF